MDAALRDRDRSSSGKLAAYPFSVHTPGNVSIEPNARQPLQAPEVVSVDRGEMGSSQQALARRSDPRTITFLHSASGATNRLRQNSELADGTAAAASGDNSA